MGLTMLCVCVCVSNFESPPIQTHQLTQAITRLIDRSAHHSEGAASLAARGLSPRVTDRQPSGEKSFFLSYGFVKLSEFGPRPPLVIFLF